MSINAYLFDLDGTVADSAPDLAIVVNGMLERMNRPAVAEADVRMWIGNGPENLAKRALLGGFEGKLDPAVHAEGIAHLFELYASHSHSHTRLFDGVQAGLDGLRKRGAKAAIVTNKYTRFTSPLLRRLAVEQDFDAVVCGDTLAEKKPSAAPLLHACQLLNVPVEQVIMVGDSITDIRAAHAAGMPVVCVNYGYNHGRDISESGPDRVISSFTELLQ